MSFERLKAAVVQILDRVPATRGKGEQATKQSLVLPLLDALGYDIWNPSEVCPEYDADFAIKKNGQKEKVDIAILLALLPRIYIETKPVDEPLDGHEGQVARYFNSTPSVTLGVLTNGVEWRFFTDTGDPNVMDLQPFHIARLDAADQGLEVLARFAKSVFSADAIRDYATELRYTAQMAQFLRKELDLRDREPSEYFIRWILKAEHMYEGVVNANVIERFKPIAKDALTRVVREIVRRSITAMEQEAATEVNVSGIESEQSPKLPFEDATLRRPAGNIPISLERSDLPRNAIETTDRELRAFEIVKALFDQHDYVGCQLFDSATRKMVSIEISYKDTTGYFGIYFNKPSWWIMRLSIEGRKNWVGFNLDETTGDPLVPQGFTKLEPSPYSEFRVQIDNPDDLSRLEAIILASFSKTIGEHQKGSAST